MKNTCSVIDASRQLVKVCERIESLSDGIECIEQREDDSSLEAYTEMRLQELEHAQRLTLMMTSLIAGEDESESEESNENADEGEGSAFAAGDLTDNLGDKTENKGEEAE